MHLYIIYGGGCIHARLHIFNNLIVDTPSCNELMWREHRCKNRRLRSQWLFSQNFCNNNDNMHVFNFLHLLLATKEGNSQGPGNFWTDYSCSILQAVQDVGSAANAESAMESLWKALAEVIGRSLASPMIYLDFPTNQKRGLSSCWFWLESDTTEVKVAHWWVSRGRPISEMPVDPTAILRRSQNDVDDLVATEGPKQLFFVWDFALAVSILNIDLFFVWPVACHVVIHH